jgi:hypothetical protein
MTRLTMEYIFLLNIIGDINIDIFYKFSQTKKINLFKTWNCILFWIIRQRTIIWLSTIMVQCFYS